jgi:hypothetical protein
MVNLSDSGTDISAASPTEFDPLTLTDRSGAHAYSRIFCRSEFFDQVNYAELMESHQKGRHGLRRIGAP